MVDMTQDTAGRDEDNAPGGNKGGLGRWLPLAVIAAGAGIGYWLFGDYLSFETLRENREALIAWRDDNYVLAVLTYMAIYIAVVAFSLPGAAVMTLTGGFLFGLVPGTIFTVTAATIGATCIFLAARTSLGATLKEKAGPWMAKFEKGFQENEISFLFLLRLVPAVPFFIANLLPAFFGVKLVTYVWTTFLGIAPGSAVYTSVGTGLGEIFASGEEISLNIFADPKVWGPFVGLIALALLPIVIKAIRGKPVAGEE